MKIKSIQGLLASNTFIVTDNDKVLIIDAGAPLADVQSALDGRKPDAIFLTHEHFDHIAHIADYCLAFYCPVYCHSATIDELKINKFNRLFAKYGGNVKIPTTFHNFKTNIDFPKVTALPCPGHSAGSLCFLVGDALFTGDVLFANTIGRTDLMPNGPALMQRTLRKLQDVKFTTAHHGHGKDSSYTQQQKNIAKHIE